MVHGHEHLAFAGIHQGEVLGGGGEGRGWAKGVERKEGQREESQGEGGREGISEKEGGK